MNQLLKEWGMKLSEHQIEKFERYYQLLMEWNQKINLTTITEKDEVERKHFVDSLSITKTKIDLSKKRIIDIGTGAGFPGIPIKIGYNEVELTLLDAREKKIDFLREVIKECELRGVKTIHGRAEDYGGKEEHRDQYDIGVARAVSNISTLSEYCLPFIKVGGRFIAYKSIKLEEELKQYKNAIQILGGNIEDVVTFQLPGSDETRKIIIINKEKETPKKYPRQAGIPEKKPIR